MAEPSQIAAVNSGDSTSVIDALPVELFIIILLEAINFESQPYPILHTFAQVSKYWLQSIISTPCLWRVIDMEYKGIAPMVIRRNPNGRLAVRCCISPEEDFLELARGQAYRWDTLELMGVIHQPHKTLLNCRTPALTMLKIISDYTHAELPVPVAPNLSHLEIARAKLLWDSPSFAGLISISLRGLSFDTLFLPKILTMLSASPALEWFALEDVSDYHAHNSHLEPPPPHNTIHLPVLRGLYLINSVSYSINAHLLGNIDAPQCRVLHALVVQGLIRNPGPMFGNLVYTLVRAMKYVHVDYHTTFMNIRISSLAPEHDLHCGGWRHENAEVNLNLKVQILYTLEARRLISGVTDLPMDGVEVSLRLDRTVPKWHHSEESSPDPNLFFPICLATWSSATILDINNRDAPFVITLLRFLSSPIVEGGQARWPLPQLASIRLRPVETPLREDTAAAALLELVEKRLAAATREGEGGQGPNIESYLPMQLKRIEGPSDILSLIRGATSAEGIHLVENDVA